MLKSGPLYDGPPYEGGPPSGLRPAEDRLDFIRLAFGRPDFIRPTFGRSAFMQAWAGLRPASWSPKMCPKLARLSGGTAGRPMANQKFRNRIHLRTQKGQPDELPWAF